MNSPATSPDQSPAWHDLRRFTDARIALGRTGGSVRTDTLLDFRLSHARARDAVHAEFDPTRITRPLNDAGIRTQILTTRATDRSAYLLRPDLGRRLSPASANTLKEWRTATATPPDVTLIISDGLSALAAERQAPATVLALYHELCDKGWNVGPVLVVPYARVKLQDEIGGCLGSRQTVMLLGERPGLGTPDSLGAYFTYRPHARCTDADRNCVSNIRPAGLPPRQAATKLARLLFDSVSQKLSGVRLKDHCPPLI